MLAECRDPELAKLRAGFSLSRHARFQISEFLECEIGVRKSVLGKLRTLPWRAVEPIDRVLPSRCVHR